MPTVNNPINVDRNSFTGTQQREVKKDLGKDDFFLILAAQLQYQDPLQPMEDREFIAQMAQFTALEQMTNIAQLQQKSNAMQQYQAFNLVGKHVEGVDKDDNKIIGLVSEVLIKDGLAVLKVDGKEIPLENLVRVFTVEEQVPDPEVPGDPPVEDVDPPGEGETPAEELPDDEENPGDEELPGEGDAGSESDETTPDDDSTPDV